MAEILTESFCERCGSRYTFESAVPRARLRGVKVLSRGLKNFVLDDKTSLDEALAAARDDTDRSLTAHQLEAFHKTFNFCMQCRQYICPNCWNDVGGRCLTCAPHLGHGVLPAPFPDLDPSLGVAPPDEIGLAAAAMNGHGHVADTPSGFDDIDRALATEPPQPEMIGGEVEALAAIDAESAEANALAADQSFAAAEADEAFAAAEAAAMAEPLPVEAMAPPEPDAVSTAAETGPPEAVVSAEASEPTQEAAAVVESEAVRDIAAAPDDIDVAPDRSVGPATSVSALLAGLQPGQSLDDALAAFEAEPDADSWEPVPLESAEPEPVQPEPPATPEAVALESPDTAAATDEVPFAAVTESSDALWAVAEPPSVEIPVAADGDRTEPMSPLEPLDEIAAGAPPLEPAAVEPAVEPVQTEPFVLEPAAVEPAAVEPEETEPFVLEPLIEPAAIETAPQPPEPPVPGSTEIAAAAAAAGAAAADVVPQPTWSILAPDPMTVADAPAPTVEPALEPAGPPPAVPADAVPAPEPNWPPQPQWPSPQPSLGLPFLGRHVVPTGGVNALWAESDRAVTAARTDNERPAGGVQPCVSCGLSLSASARFCRRCGTSQVG